MPKSNSIILPTIPIREWPLKIERLLVVYASFIYVIYAQKIIINKLYKIICLGHIHYICPERINKFIETLDKVSRISTNISSNQDSWFVGMYLPVLGRTRVHFYTRRVLRTSHAQYKSTSLQNNKNTKSKLISQLYFR
jgi:hypothetical protein